MKKNIFLLLAITCPSFFFAQQTKLENGSTTYEKSLRPAVHVVLEPSAKDVAKAWKSYVSDNLGQKLKGGNSLMSAEGVNILQISDQMLNFYTQIEDNKPSGTSMYVFAGKGADQFFNPTDDQVAFDKMRGIVKNFLGSYLPTYYNTMIAETQKNVEKTQKSLESINKTVEKNDSGIKKNEEKIKSLQQDNDKMKAALNDAQKSKKEQEDLLKSSNQKLSEQKSNFEAAKAAITN